MTNSQLINSVLQEHGIKEKLYISFIEKNLQGIALVDTELRFVVANGAFSSTLEFPNKDHLNRFHISALPFSKDSRFNIMLNQLVTNEVPRFIIETEFRTIQDSPKYLKLKMVRIGSDDYFEGAFLILEDITPTKQRQLTLEAAIADLQQKNKQLQRYIDSNLQLENFAYLASHDMKEPLRMIGNFSQLLEKRYESQLDNNGKEYLQYIVDGVKNMNLFINDLLDFSRVSGREHHVQTINLNAMLFLIRHELANELENQKIQFSITSLPSQIIGCKEKIRSLFQHLISNAIKFSKRGVQNRISLNVREENQYWHFSIHDSGIGIKEEFFEKIFLLFKRLHPRNEYSGSGIGLALCKKIVEQHGGEIWVESEFGEGTIFHFTIPKNK